MKAGIYYGPGKVRIEELPKPVAGEKDIIVKVIRSGICGSDVTAYRFSGRMSGVFMKGEEGSDGQFGHEISGIVDSVGEAVHDIKEGDHVFINPVLSKRAGMMAGVPGGFSEYVLVEDAKYEYNVWKWNDDVSFDVAALLEPLSVATHGKNKAQIKAYDKVVIYGAGSIGLCALCAVLNSGCAAPVIIDYDEKRLAVAREIGGVTFHPPTQGKAADFLMEHFGKALTPFMTECPNVDAFIDCAGAKEILDEIMHMSKEGVRITVVASYKEPIKLDMFLFQGLQLYMNGSRGYDQKDIIEAFNNINMSNTKVLKIVTHHFEQDDLEKAFEVASNPETGAIKVLIDFTE